MAAGDTSVQVVESPITAAKVKTALDTAIAATSTNAITAMTSFNQGRSIVISCTEQ